MTRNLIAALSLAALTAAAAAPANAAVVSAMNATLSASPTLSTGHCPAVITFRGSITVRGRFDHPVQIGYQFLRSDNATGPISYYMVSASGTRGVSTTWTLGGPGLPSYVGWEQLKAWPTHHDGGFGYAFSPKAGFKVVCRPAAAPPPR